MDFPLRWSAIETKHANRDIMMMKPYLTSYHQTIPISKNIDISIKKKAQSDFPLFLSLLSNDERIDPIDM